MPRDDDDYFPPIRRRNQSSSGEFPTWIGPVIGATIIGVAVIFVVILVWARKRGEPERANAPLQNAAAEIRSLGPVPPEPTRPAPSAPDRPAPVVPFIPGPPVPPVLPAPTALKPGIADVEPIGGFFANNDYREYRNDGAILIGFEVGLGAVPDTAVVTYLRPIWLTARGEQFGTAYGRTRNPIATVKARAGYAIGGIQVKGGGAMEGLCFTFMRRGAKHLLKDDFYISDWYGEQTRKLPESTLRQGEGGFVIGIHGKRFDDRGGVEFNNSGCIGTIGFTTWVKD